MTNKDLGLSLNSLPCLAIFTAARLCSTRISLVMPSTPMSRMENDSHNPLTA
jgi:hypothetical protein